MSAQQKGATILVVDDEDAVRTLLRECFELDGFRVLEARDGKELIGHLGSGTVDLVTLDVNLGGENGFDLARQVRATNNLPIIMISGKSDTIDRVVGLELGADDYITKPFQLREVLARVRAVLRRYDKTGYDKFGGPSERVEAASASGPSFAFEGWTLDINRRELRAATGETRELTTAEFDLLRIFVERPARVMSRDNIMDLLKGHEWSPFDRSIDSLIVRLRKKVEPEPDTPRLIKTVRGVGYVFAVEVKRL